MFLPANAVKLRRCQCALLFCSPSHNGNQGFVRVVRRFRGPQRVPKLRLLGWLSAAEEIGLGSILKGRTFRCAVEPLIFVILSEDAFAIANASESKDPYSSTITTVCYPLTTNHRFTTASGAKDDSPRSHPWVACRGNN